MVEKLDSMGRRKRTVPQSTGKSISLQERDWLWLKKLQEHGPLPSSFLLTYCKESHRNEKRSQERLTDLFHENNTPGGGYYLTRPMQQFRTIDSRYNSLVYDLTKVGRKALVDAGLETTSGCVNAGPWVHRFMVACITASVELACMDRDDVNFISGSKILERVSADLSCHVTITQPNKQKLTKKLIPDAIFGLEYVCDDRKTYRFFIVEADRATEPATTTNFNRKSFVRNLMQYQTYVEGGVYRDHLKLTAPLLVLNIVPDEKRMAKMIEVAAKQFPSGNSYMLFQTWEDFGVVFRPPEPKLDLLNDVWERCGCPSLKIDSA